MLTANLSLKDKFWGLTKYLVKGAAAVVIWLFVTLIQAAYRHLMLTMAIVFAFLEMPIEAGTLLVLAFYFELASINDNTKLFKGK